MPIRPAELASELKTLRKGRGLQAPRLAEQVGPMLRELCGIGENESAASIREKLTKCLHILANGLPEDLRLVVTTALALQADTQHQFLRERVQSLAEHQRRDVRTIRRRMDEGFELLAEIAARPPADQPRGTVLGWYTERLEAILRLDKDSPECFERRLIVAEHDGLEIVQPSITIPRNSSAADDHDLYCEPMFGTTMVDRHRKPGNRFVYDLALPVPLGIGQKHEYGLIWRIPDSQEMRSHYVVFPDRRCDEFELRIRFGADRTPELLWRAEEVFHREIDDPQPEPQTPLAVDRVGEVHVSFRNLLPGHGYGVQWRNAPE
ncbi:MAG TPA: hypothetical protein VH333_11070 [Pseudonocardiaceae bacterium]|nr:hypothetical protein [Pseudonocardiaceae bacterium]